MNLFDKLKAIQSETTPMEDVETTSTPDTIVQCECGGSLSGACPECDDFEAETWAPKADTNPPILDKLQAIGDEHAVNPPVVWNDGLAEQPKSSVEVHEAPAMFRGVGKKCPTCGKLFKRLGSHKCKNAPVDEPPVDCPPTLDPTDQMDPIHEDEKVADVNEAEYGEGSVGEPSTKELTDHVTIQGTVDDDGRWIASDLPTYQAQDEQPPIPEPGFDLYIDVAFYCGTDGGKNTQHFEDIINSIGGQVAAMHKVPIWKAVPFGAGPGYLAQALEAWLSDTQPTGKIVVLSGSMEYQACRDVLIRRARNVYMGVR